MSPLALGGPAPGGGGPVDRIPWPMGGAAPAGGGPRIICGCCGAFGIPPRGGPYPGPLIGAEFPPNCCVGGAVGWLAGPDEKLRLGGANPRGAAPICCGGGALRLPVEGGPLLALRAKAGPPLPESGAFTCAGLKGRKAPARCGCDCGACCCCCIFCCGGPPYGWYGGLFMAGARSFASFALFGYRYTSTRDRKSVV